MSRVVYSSHSETWLTPLSTVNSSCIASTMTPESVDASQSSEQPATCSRVRPEWLRDLGYKLEASLMSKLLVRCGIRQVCGTDVRMVVCPLLSDIIHCRLNSCVGRESPTGRRLLWFPDCRSQRIPRASTQSPGFPALLCATIRVIIVAQYST